MGNAEILLQLLLPVGMAIGGVAAWLAIKRENAPRPDRPSWRDDSLDEWRHQREAEIEAERANRAATAGSAPESGQSTTTTDTTTTRHTRLGG